MKVNFTKGLKVARKVAIVLLWIGLFSGVVFVLAFSNKMESQQSVKKVLVSIYPIDLHFYNRQRVLELVRKGVSNEQKLMGLSISDIEVEKLEAVIKKQALVEDAEVYANLHGDLHIKVQQRKPILRILRYDGTEYYLDQYGVKMPLSENYTAHVLVANGNIFERYHSHDSVYSFVGKQLYNLASYVDKHPFYKALIEQIFVTAENELILVPRLGSRFILFGNTENLEKKFAKLLVFYQEGLNRVGWNTYKSIDIRFEGQVICKK